MAAIEKVVGLMLLLVALYLVLANSGAFNSILKGLSAFNVAILGTLQGRYVEGVGGVKVGGNSIDNASAGLTGVDYSGGLLGGGRL